LQYRAPGTGADFDLFSFGLDHRAWGGGWDADLYNHDKWLAVVQGKNKEKLEAVKTAIEQFKVDNERYPEMLSDLWVKPSYAKKWEKAYIASDPKDAFDNLFTYRNPGTEQEPYDLISPAADRLLGGTGADEDLWNHLHFGEPRLFSNPGPGRAELLLVSSRA
jgi:type II secretion system protein G